MRRARLPRFEAANIADNLALVAVVSRIADRSGVTTAQVALAWVLSRGDDIVPIPGSDRLSYLEDNVAAAGLTLSAEDLDELGTAFRPGAAAGARYDADAMSHLDVDR